MYPYANTIVACNVVTDAAGLRSHREKQPTERGGAREESKGFHALGLPHRYVSYVEGTDEGPALPMKNDVYRHCIPVRTYRCLRASDRTRSICQKLLH